MKYPVFLDLEGQKCTVVGEGILAAEKSATLAEAGAIVTVISSRDYRPGDLVGARLVIDASDNAQPGWNKRLAHRTLLVRNETVCFVIQRTTRSSVRSWRGSKS